MEITCERCGKVIHRRTQQGYDLCFSCHKQALADQKQLFRDILEWYHNQGAHICVTTLSSNSI